MCIIDLTIFAKIYFAAFLRLLFLGELFDMFVFLTKKTPEFAVVIVRLVGNSVIKFFLTTDSIGLFSASFLRLDSWYLFCRLGRSFPRFCIDFGLFREIRHRQFFKRVEHTSGARIVGICQTTPEHACEHGTGNLLPFAGHAAIESVSRLLQLLLDRFEGFIILVCHLFGFIFRKTICTESLTIQIAAFISGVIAAQNATQQICGMERFFVKIRYPNPAHHVRHSEHAKGRGIWTLGKPIAFESPPSMLSIIPE